MTIYTIGSQKFLGDVTYANHSVAYPTAEYCVGYENATISSELSALLTSSGINFRDVAVQADFDDYTKVNTLMVSIGSATHDTIDDRCMFAFNRISLTGSSAENMNNLYDPAGITAQGANINTSNRILNLGNREDNVNQNLGFTNVDSALGTPMSWFGCSDADSLFLCRIGYDFGEDLPVFCWWYYDTYNPVNTEFSYYSADVVSRSILGTGSNYLISGLLRNEINLRHYIASTAKPCLRSGDADYSIDCSSGGPSTTQYMTDFIPLDDNTTLGNPGMGVSRILRVAVGTYTTGALVKYTGDLANRAWFCLGPYTTNLSLFAPVYTTS